MNLTGSPTRPPLFSVIIPTHGRPDALRRAVGSVLEQTFADLEVIVVDDCGMPPAEPFDDAQVRVVRLAHNQGVSAARNRGIEEAKGAWVAFLDDDDVWYPGRLEAIANEIAKVNSDRYAIFTTDLHIDDDGFIAGTYTDERPFHNKDQLLQSILRPYLTVMFVARTDLLAEIGGFDTVLRGAEDADILARLMLAGGQVRLIPEVLGCYNRGVGRTRDHEVTWSGKLLWLNKLKNRPELTIEELAAIDVALKETRNRLLRVRATRALADKEPRRAFLAAAATVSETSLRRRAWFLIRAILPNRLFQHLTVRCSVDTRLGRVSGPSWTPNRSSARR